MWGGQFVDFPLQKGFANINELPISNSEILQ